MKTFKLEPHKSSSFQDKIESTNSASNNFDKYLLVLIEKQPIPHNFEKKKSRSIHFHNLFKDLL